MDKTTIKIKGRKYPVQSTGEVISENLLSGYLFRILDQMSDNVIGCLSCYVLATVTAIWNNNWDKRACGPVFWAFGLILWLFLLALSLGTKENLRNCFQKTSKTLALAVKSCF